ncbi:MAG: hypothetical protein GF401_03630 [Chitinivibrionales bacterium]|nr:hypothetical protein [Chitinivibrionales bacterium]
MKRNRIITRLVSILFIPGLVLHFTGTVNAADNDLKDVRLSALVEYGFVAVLDHRIQFGKDGDYFDYRADGAQDVLFPALRLSAELTLKNRHTFVVLYQPLRLETEARLDQNLRVDILDFAAETPMHFLYDFPFYRFSYLYDFISGTTTELAAGLTLQIRNATIRFASLNGELLRDNRDIGLVPALKFRWTHRMSHLVWVGAEADGIYAPVSYLNGSDEEIVGAILDASLRAGTFVFNNKGRVFANFRYLGGGAVGTNTDDQGPGDGYVKNWLHFLIVSLGASYEL